MMKKLLTIYDSFEVENKGTVVTARNDADKIKLTAGSKVLLKTPSGIEFLLEVIAIEHFSKCFTRDSQLGLLLGNQINANEIPRETEIWQ